MSRWILVCFTDEDRPQAVQIRRGLSTYGIDVSVYRPEVRAGYLALEPAVGGVIALWTATSLGDEGLRGEARAAQRSGRLINIAIGTPAAPFGPLAISLDGWDGSEPSSSWTKLVDAATALVDRKGTEPTVAERPGAKLDGSAERKILERIRGADDPSSAAPNSRIRKVPLPQAEDKSTSVEARHWRRLPVIASIAISVLTAGALAAALFSPVRHSSASALAPAARTQRPSPAASGATAPATGGATESAIAAMAVGAPPPSEAVGATARVGSSGRGERAKLSAALLTPASDSSDAASSEASSQAASSNPLSVASSALPPAELDGDHVAPSGAAAGAAPIGAPPAGSARTDGTMNGQAPPS
jgi:hypothetical protein